MAQDLPGWVVYVVPSRSTEAHGDGCLDGRDQFVMLRV